MNCLPEGEGAEEEEVMRVARSVGERVVVSRGILNGVEIEIGGLGFEVVYVCFGWFVGDVERDLEEDRI